jgi:polar amino acid transport system permease protein
VTAAPSVQGSRSVPVVENSAHRDDIDIATLRHVKPKHYGRLAAMVLIIAFAAFLIRAFAVGQIDWATVREYIVWPTILWGLVNTIWMSCAAMALGIVLGVAFAVARGSPNPILRGASIFYAWLFRGTPVILQLLIWFNLALVFPRLGIPGVWDVKTVYVITPVVATLLGLGLNEGAYISEIVRAGLLSVDAIGMSRMTALRRIILPQAMRVVVPPLGNEFIGLIKITSLASIIGFSDLLHNAQDIYYANAKVMELLIVAALWYLVVVTVLSIGQSLIERRFGRGFASTTARR